MKISDALKKGDFTQVLTLIEQKAAAALDAEKIGSREITPLANTIIKCQQERKKLTAETKTEKPSNALDALKGLSKDI